MQQIIKGETACPQCGDFFEYVEENKVYCHNCHTFKGVYLSEK